MRMFQTLQSTGYTHISGMFSNKNTSFKYIINIFLFEYTNDGVPMLYLTTTNLTFECYRQCEQNLSLSSPGIMEYLQAFVGQFI